MSATVCVYKTPLSEYSIAWKDCDEFPEKEYLRDASRILGGTENILKSVVRPGDSVVVKPNWVLDRHSQGGDIFSVITHSAILRAVVDLVYEALDGSGTICIADAPQWDCDFGNLLATSEVECISRYYRRKHGFEIGIMDLRQTACKRVPGQYISVDDKIQLKGDPAGYQSVNLGADSAFNGIQSPENIYGADYDRRETQMHHNGSRHEYLVSKTILNASVIVNVPKLKVHKKVGVTLNAKSMVGINGNKNWLAHFRTGSPSCGGDEYPDTEDSIAKFRASARRWALDNFLSRKSRVREKAFNMVRAAYRMIKPVFGDLGTREVSIDGGNWHGNDTAWRMTADLARVVLFANRDGTMKQTAQRRFFSVIDGIHGGELNGPLTPDLKRSGVLVLGNNLLAVDLVASRVMGFDWRKMKTFMYLYSDRNYSLGGFDPSEISVRSNIAEWTEIMNRNEVSSLKFRPHPGWVGHIELDNCGCEGSES